MTRLFNLCSVANPELKYPFDVIWFVCIVKLFAEAQMSPEGRLGQKLKKSVGLDMEADSQHLAQLRTRIQKTDPKRDTDGAQKRPALQTVKQVSQAVGAVESW